MSDEQTIKRYTLQEQHRLALGVETAVVLASDLDALEQQAARVTVPAQAEHLHDVLGRAVDTAENFMEYGTDATTPAMARLPVQMRIEALSNGLKELRDTIKALYFEVGGEDVWS